MEGSALDGLMNFGVRILRFKLFCLVCSDSSSVFFDIQFHLCFYLRCWLRILSFSVCEKRVFLYLISNLQNLIGFADGDSQWKGGELHGLGR